MVTLVRILKSNKQVMELMCLVVSLPLVFLNLEMHLAQYAPKHSSVATLVNYRKTRESTFEEVRNQSEEVKRTTEKQEEVLNEFDFAYKEVFVNELSERSEVVQQVCKDHKGELSWLDDDRLRHMKHNDVWDVIHKVVFCPIAKVASTSWFLNFLQMSGVNLTNIDTVMDQLSDLNRTAGENWQGSAGGRGIRAVTRYIYEPPKIEDLEELTNVFNKMTGFMMVRHPFVRLVSAYEDKMLNPHPFPYKYHHKIQEKIKQKRTNKKKTINFPKDLLTSQRYKYMLKNKLITIGQLSKQPSFPEFVDWLINDRAGSSSNPHSWSKDNTWVPFYAICPVCDIPYTVLKLDSENNEISHFIEEKQLPIKSTSAVHTVGGKRNSAHKTDKYFSELSKNQVSKLYDLYRFDFQLFGYDHQKYIDLAKDNTEPKIKIKEKNEFDLAFEELQLMEKETNSSETSITKNNNNKRRKWITAGKFRNNDRNKQNQKLRKKDAFGNKEERKHQNKMNTNKNKKNSTIPKNKNRKNSTIFKNKKTNFQISKNKKPKQRNKEQTV